MITELLVMACAGLMIFISAAVGITGYIDRTIERKFRKGEGDHDIRGKG